MGSAFYIMCSRRSAPRPLGYGTPLFLATHFVSVHVMGRSAVINKLIGMSIPFSCSFIIHIFIQKYMNVHEAVCAGGLDKAV